MKDFVLLNSENTYKIGLNGKRQLSLAGAVNENITSTIALTAHECGLFSADIDTSGVVHVACITAGTLTYIRISDGKTSSTQLMRLPEKFSVISVNIEADESVRLNYSVKSVEGCAVIDYTLTGDTWKGRNLFTSADELFVRAVKKREECCYTVKKTENEYSLINAFQPDNVIFFSHSSIEYVQAVSDGVVFSCGGSIYFNENEVAQGKEVFVVDACRALVHGVSLREIAFTGGYSHEASMPRGAREYILCTPEHDKRMLISSPFPYIRTEIHKTADSGILQEVYMQQRTIFALQADVKSLKARMNKLEEAYKHKRL